MKRKNQKKTKLFIYSIITCFLFSQIALPDEVKYVKKDEKAPFDGYLFTPEKEHEIRLINEKFEVNEEIVKLQGEKIAIYEKRIEVRDKQIDALANRVVEQKEESFFTKAGMFILGALVTTGIVFGVSKVSK